MIPRPRSLPRAFGKGQRGAYLVIMAVGMLVLIGFVGLAVDLARQMVVHAKLQNAVDACALAAVVELNGLSDAKGRSDAERAKAIGAMFLRKNLPTSDRPAAFLSGAATSEVSTGTWIGTDGNPVPSVTCKATDTNANFFIQVLDAALGKSTMTATATAIATPSSLACVTPLMIRSSLPPQEGDVFAYSEAETEDSFSVMQNNDPRLGGNGRGHTQIGNLDGLAGWCSVPFDGTTKVWIEKVASQIPPTAAKRVARGWCERWGGIFREINETSYVCDGATASELSRRYTTVAVVDPGATTSRNAKGIKDSACVELTGDPPTAMEQSFKEGAGKLKLKYLGRNDRRCISQGVPAAATSALGPYVPALVE